MIFDRFDKKFRSPTGAVKEGTRVKFRLRLPRSLGVKSASMEVVRDGDNSREIRRLCWIGLDLDEDVYFVTFSFDKCGLFWYNFIIDTCDGRMRISENGRESVLRREDEPFAAFQMTVFSRDFKTPDWLKNALIYQIFPDRFFASGKEKTVDRGRTLHKNWSDPPVHHNDPFKITNSDFFGGDLRGIEQKLPYIASLGVTVIYLNPIFEAYSNHRYDTGDYEKIDPLLGDENDLKNLCESAKKLGIRIILDGVFSHTGDDSKYFNAKGTYKSLGAAQSKDSPYYGWYEFEHYPNKYTSWWGVPSLPCVDESTPSYLEYITGERGIARKYLRSGASGWRLDVADELPDVFLDALRAAVKTENADAAIIGEVWEDASNKTAYSQRRRYLLGDQLDSVMNYPFSDAIKAFIKNGNSKFLADTVLSICEHYPKDVVPCLMNMLSTHDTARILTALAGEDACGKDRDWQSITHISESDLPRAKRMLRLAAAVQYTLPGTPSLYYGDEALMQGYFDPFCRGTYPWGGEDEELIEYYRALGELRKQYRESFGQFTLIYEKDGLIVYKNGAVTVAANARGSDAAYGKAVIPAVCAVISYKGRIILKSSTPKKV